MPSGSWMYPDESESVTTFAPSSVAFMQAYWATLPDPEMQTVLPLKESPRVASISCAK